MVMSPDTHDTTTRTSWEGITVGPTVVVAVWRPTVILGFSNAFGGHGVNYEGDEPEAIDPTTATVPDIDSVTGSFFAPHESFTPGHYTIAVTGPLRDPVEGPVVELLDRLITPATTDTSSPEGSPAVQMSAELCMDYDELTEGVKDTGTDVGQRNFPFMESFVLLPHGGVSLFSWGGRVFYQGWWCRGLWEVSAVGAAKVISKGDPRGPIESLAPIHTTSKGESSSP